MTTVPRLAALLAAGCAAACSAAPVGARERFVSLPAARVLVGRTIEIAAMERHEDEAPRHVHVPTFEIAADLVTNAQFAAFLNSDVACSESRDALWAANRGMVDDVDPLRLRDGIYECREGVAEHPADRVTWLGAARYCEWRSRTDERYDYRLPNEHEWEYAARGTAARVWPWGDDPPDTSRGFRWQRKPRSRERWSSCPVGSHPRNATPDGVRDLMAYDIWEWCSDAAHAIPTGHAAAFAGRGPCRMARGGPTHAAAEVSFVQALFSETQHAGRTWSRWWFDEDETTAAFGFRIVRTPK